MSNTGRISYTPLYLYIAYAAIVLALFFLTPFSVKTDLMDIVSSPEGTAQDTILKNLSKDYQAKVNVLFSADKFSTSKAAGKYFAWLLKDDSLKVNFELTENLSSIRELLAEYNYHLLSDKSKEKLINEEYDLIAGQAQSMIYSPFKANILSLEQDPFLLASDFMLNLKLLKSAFAPKQDVLSAVYQGKVYAYMSIDLSKSRLFSPEYLISTNSKLKKAKMQTIERYPDVEINISGVPLHSALATSASITEVNYISLLSVLLILVISFAVFKSLNCFIYALFTITISFIMAFALSAIVFGAVHIFVLVFGVSLIGLCIDYHIHYYVERAYAKGSLSALNKIKKSIFISLITSLLGFVIMAFSGINIIMQMAIFAFIGLSNAYVIIRFIYPIVFIRLKTKQLPQRLVDFEAGISTFISKILEKHYLLKFMAIILVFGVGISYVKFSDNLKDLYTPDPKLLQNDINFAKISGMGSAPVMLVIRGADGQKVLEKDEEVRIFLDSLIEEGTISAYKSVSEIIPSLKTQRENYQLVRDLFDHKLFDYALDLGLDDTKIIRNFYQQQNKLITIDKLKNYAVFDSIKGFFITEGGAASVILVENVKDKQVLADYVNAEENVIIHDQIAELSNILKLSRENAAVSLVVALLLISALMIVIYRSARRALLIISPSFLAVIVTLGIYGYCGVQVSLFHILALFLVVCFGVDYSIFRLEAKGRKDHAGVAVMISCLTTLASFGMLGLTGFAVTRALGMTLSIGIIISYLFSPIASLPKEDILKTK